MTSWSQLFDEAVIEERRDTARYEELMRRREREDRARILAEDDAVRALWEALTAPVRPGHAVAWVIGVSEYQFKVRCPWCDAVHLHGIGLGWRAPHCVDIDRSLRHKLPHYELRLSAGLKPKIRARALKALESASKSASDRGGPKRKP